MGKRGSALVAVAHGNGRSARPLPGVEKVFALMFSRPQIAPDFLMTFYPFAKKLRELPKLTTC
jgi:hypothetical protein